MIVKTGIVKFFDEEKGFGFINPENESKDIFFHKSGIKNNLILHQHDKVRFKIGQGRKGDLAIDIEKVE